jgi:tetratricopeptide (TPR) repeat protein
MNTECRSKLYYATLLSFLLAAIFTIAGCANPEKAKAEHLAKGEAYLKESKFQEASIEFRNAIQLDDGLAAAHWGLSRAYEGLQRGPEFFNELKTTVALDPKNLEAKTKLGTLYLAASKRQPELVAEAEKLANEILQRDPNYIEGHILKGSVFFAQDKRDQALAELNNAIQLDPKRVESYLSLARFYAVINDPAKAEETFKQAVAINNNSALAHTAYGSYLMQLNRLPDAERELAKAVEVDPSDRNARFVLASFYLVNKQTDKAEESYKALAALDTKPESQAVLADFYVSVNRLDDAVRIYQDILAKAPEYTQGRYRLGEIMLMRGDTQGANTQIDYVLQKDSKDRQALLLRARVRANSGQSAGTQAAIEDLKEVLKQEPNSKPGLYFMAQANFNLGMLDQARVFAGDLERAYPDYLPAKLIQAQIALAGARAPGDSKAPLTLASQLLDRLDKLAPDQETSAQMISEIRARTYIVKGTAEAQLGNISAARQDLNKAGEIAPRNTDVYNNLAGLAIVENKPDEAVGLYEKALAISSTDFNALNGLVNFYTRRNEPGKAHARLDEVISRYPNHAPLHYLKAHVYGVERNQQGAESELRKTLELDPNYVQAYSSLGALFINTKQEDRAIAEFKKITEIRPENSTAYTLIGILYDSRKDYDTAADNYRKALEKDQNAVIAANNLAWLYAVYDKGNLDEAVRLAQGAVQKNPNVPGFMDTLGWVYYKKGLYAVAVEQLQKAVSLDEAAAKVANGPPSGNYRYHLGMALNAKGDKEAAKRELTTAVRLAEKNPFPEADDARKALATL